MTRQASVSIAQGGPQFNLERFEAVERLSEPFVIEVEGFSAKPVDWLPHIGKPVSLDAGDGSQHVRYFHGRLTEAELTSADIDGTHYKLTLRPWLYLLDQNRNYRIFQEKSVVEIAKLVLADAHMNDVDFDKLTGTYSPREYCVQYKESDFNFLSRLFEDEGIYYYFRHEQNAHRLVFCDAKSAHKATPKYETIPMKPVKAGELLIPNTVGSWTERVKSLSQMKVSRRAYDFTKPQTSVKSTSQVAAQHPGDALEVYEYTDDFTEADDGTSSGNTWLAAARAQRRVFTGEADALGLTCGGLFKISESTISEFNKEYLITALSYVVNAEGYSSSRDEAATRPRNMILEAIPSDIVYRPSPVTDKPLATGVETAVVTGPSGEVLYVDEHGRVKVRFHWDRSESDPAKSSCWIRVSHHAAGLGFGNVDLPRVGQEVLVDFINGDPDRPLITGRVYNAVQTHAYALPDNKTRSLWKTETVGSIGSYEGAELPAPSGKGFNEIRLEDKGGSEEIYIHAQREMLTEVLLDDKFIVKRDRNTRVGRDRVTAIKNNEKKTVEEGDETHEVSKGKRDTTIEGNDTLTVKSGNLVMTVSKGTVTIDAAQSITLKVGDTTLTMDTSSITLKAQTISSEAQSLNKMKGGMAEITGDSMASMKAAMININ